MKIHVSQLPCPEAEFLAKLADYRAAVAAHRTSIGKPAPFPEYEAFRALVDSDPEIERDPAPTPRELAIRALVEKRKAEALLQENRLLAAASLEPDAPAELVAYVASEPELSALAMEEAAKVTGDIPVVRL